MPITRTFTVNDAGDPEAVTVVTVCKKVTIGEDPSVGATWGDVDFNVRKLTIADVPRRRPGGSSYVFEAAPGRQFEPGDIVGYLDFVSGSSTFFQDEN